MLFPIPSLPSALLPHEKTFLSIVRNNECSSPQAICLIIIFNLIYYGIE